MNNFNSLSLLIGISLESSLKLGSLNFKLLILEPKNKDLDVEEYSKTFR